MKQHLNINDLLELSAYQRERLNDLWQPRIYDLAMAAICVDVEKEEFCYNEFVIGDIGAYQNYHGCTVILRDIKAANLDAGETTPEPDETETATSQEMEFSGDDFTEPAEQFDQYLKDDCLPLLNIGRLIEMLQKLSYGDDYFYLTIPVIEEQNYLIGRDNYREDYENRELCDLLWECLKEKL